VDAPTACGFRSFAVVMPMELVFVGLMVVGLLIFVHSLRLRGCLSFGVWMLTGMVVMGLLLCYVSGWLHL